MGLRIDAFAVDLDRLMPLLQQSMADLLFTIAERASQIGDYAFPSVFDPDKKVRYLVNAERTIVRAGPRCPMTPVDKVHDVPTLARSVAEHIRLTSPYELKFLMNALVACPELGVAHEITRGYKRWWICSLLHTARNIVHLAPPIYNELERLCSQMLGRWNCRYRVVPAEASTHDQFPALPPADLDMWLAVFDSTRSRRLLQLFEEVLALQPRFASPDTMGLNEESVPWDEWVREMIERFQAMRTLPVRELRLLIFTG